MKAVLACLLLAWASQAGAGVVDSSPQGKGRRKLTGEVTVQGWSGGPGLAYNLYMSDVPGNGFWKQNSLPITSTTHTIQGLEAGKTYYFHLRAVNLGVESAPGREFAMTAMPSGGRLLAAPEKAADLDMEVAVKHTIFQWAQEKVSKVSVKFQDRAGKGRSRALMIEADVKPGSWGAFYVCPRTRLNAGKAGKMTYWIYCESPLSVSPILSEEDRPGKQAEAWSGAALVLPGSRRWRKVSADLDVMKESMEHGTCAPRCDKMGNNRLDKDRIICVGLSLQTEGPAEIYWDDVSFE